MKQSDVVFLTDCKSLTEGMQSYLMPTSTAQPRKNVSMFELDILKATASKF